MIYMEWPLQTISKIASAMLVKSMTKSLVKSRVTDADTDAFE